MNATSTRTGLRVISIALISIAFLLIGQQYSLFLEFLSLYPDGLVVAGLPAEGLSRELFEERLRVIYNTPIELTYRDAIIQVSPSDLGFSLKIDQILAEADQKRENLKSFAGFWAFLMDQPVSSPNEIPIQYHFDPSIALKFFRQEIEPRYNLPTQAPIPIPGTSLYSSGTSGFELDESALLIEIEQAAQSLSVRSAIIPIIKTDAPPPSIQNLETQLQQIIDVSQFDGIAEIYVSDLENAQTLHFARDNMQDIPPDIAFTAASTIKIPIMISTYIRTNEPMDPEVYRNLEKMISVSENEPADWLMQNLLGGNLGPLEITDDIRTLGLENTFLAGFFYMGAPLLQRFETKANTRTDINLQPDAYNQTVAREMGFLLEGIYRCSQDMGGVLLEKFPAQITPNECRQMVELLKSDKLPYLITAGLPEGTPVAHKHGWIEEADGLLHTMSDSALVFSSKKDYVLAIYLYHPVNLVFDSGNYLIAQISQAVYNYNNPVFVDP